MRIIEITALESGAHRNRTYNGSLPDGWAVDRYNLCVENFPFGDVTVEEVDGVMTVTSWTPGTRPEAEPEPEPTAQEDTDAMLIDHEYRLTLLELGVTE